MNIHEDSNDWEPDDSTSQFCDDFDAVKQEPSEQHETIENVPHPICPINMYFEGDEDKCSVKHCDFDLESRSCSQSCKIDLEELQKAVVQAKSIHEDKPLEDPTYPEEIEVIPNVNKLNRFGIFIVSSTNETEVLAECSNLHFVQELVHRYNTQRGLLNACKKYQEAIKLLYDTNPNVEICLGSALALNKSQEIGDTAITEAEKGENHE